MLDRDEIFRRAYKECLTEMYAKSQPSANYDELVEGVKNGTIEDGVGNHVFDRHYLSHAEFDYILDKYCKAYGFVEHWKPDMEVLENYLVEGGLKDSWVPESEPDKDGFKNPGYRKAVSVPSILAQMKELLGDDSLAEAANKIVLDTVANCKDFYMFDREAHDFRCSVALGASPTSNSKTVVEHWKKQGVDIEIKERNPLLLWEMDSYGDEFEEVMKDEYGDNWEEYWWERHNEAERKKKEERDEKMKEILEKNPDLARYLQEHEENE